VIRPFPAALGAALAALVLAACGGSAPPRLYTLDASATGAAGGGGKLSVYIGPVIVPESIDRPQFVVRSGANEVVALDGHRWAEPLKVAIGRVLAVKLSRELGTPEVGAFPGAALADAAYRVQVEIQRFESAPGSAVTLEAVWSVRRAAGGAAVKGRTVATEPVPGDLEAVAAAHARDLEALARDIAGAIGRLEAGGK
jgi:hypothetical protein